MKSIYLIKLISKISGIKNCVAYEDKAKAELAFKDSKQWEDEDHHYELEEITLVLA